jgi:2-polyprenyl-3-methyl-5-hydroxy-6-metoxy-1,4-benzoquinol methylase
MSSQEHWANIYATKPTDTVSWYQAEPARSLAWIAAAAPPPHAAVVDVGAGASFLVDRLVARGYAHVGALDIAPNALELIRKRLGADAARVDWFAGSVLDFTPPRAYDVWHDRAVLHFLREPADQARYVEVLTRSLKPGGHAIIATFAVGGPLKCSGLEIVQYDAAKLQALLGPRFTLEKEELELHRTPGGSEQKFQWARFGRR